MALLKSDLLSFPRRRESSIFKELLYLKSVEHSVVTFRLCKWRPPFTNCQNLPEAMRLYANLRQKKVFCFYEDNALAIWTFASLAFFTPQIYAAGFKAKHYDYAFLLTATVLLAVAIALALRLFQRACQLRPVAPESRSLL